MTQRGTRAALAFLRPYLSGHRREYMLGAGSVVLYVCLFAAGPPLFGWALSAVLEGLGSEVVLRRIVWFVLVAVASAGLRFFSRTFLFNTARSIEYELRNDLFVHLQRLPQSFYFSWPTGDLMSRCVNDLNSIRLMLGVGIVNILQAPFLYLASIIVMMSLNPTLTLLSLTPFPLFILLARGFGRVNHSANLAVQEGLGRLSNQVQESISGIALVKAYAMEGATQKKFNKATESLYRRHIRLVRVSSAIPTMARLLPGLTMWVVLWFGGRAVQGGEMDVAQFFIFALYIHQLTFPTVIIGWVFAIVQRGAASIERIQEVLETEPSIQSRNNATSPTSVSGQITFQNLNFSYKRGAGKLVLRDINLNISSGSVVGITGPVGSGKTSLVSLIPRLYEVPDGMIRIDGIDLNNWDLGELRKNIATVPQDSFLFSMSVADNISFGIPDVEMAKISQATRSARLMGDVDELPHRFDTIVGERGVMLSGGQRQRTALARALALQRPILILDDTLSAVDSETEAAIQSELSSLYEGKTVIVVSHRVSSLKDADQIVVLLDGAISEIGTHDELAVRTGWYSRLVQAQALEDEIQSLDGSGEVTEGG